MQRRKFSTILGGAATWPLAARAQQPAGTPKLAIWMGRPDDAEGRRLATAFRAGMLALGWTIDSNIHADFHWVTGDDVERTRTAKEMVAPRPNVLVVETTVGIATLSRESRTIPMIFVNVSDPVGSGFVPNLAHPGGNITGFMSNEPTLGGKWPELLKEVAPRTALVGFLYNPDTASYAEAFLRQAEAAALSIGVKLFAAQARNDAEIERTMSELASQPDSGLIVLPEATTNARSDVIIALAARHRVPAIYAYRHQAAAGGLISYGVDLADSFRAAATYADRILRGEKPADLPVQAPTKFDLVVNLKTAKSLGLTVPTATLLRATELVE
jgi:putative ABC transport system substrate-binding protein